jgi:phage I-like protein
LKTPETDKKTPETDKKTPETDKKTPAEEAPKDDAKAPADEVSELRAQLAALTEKLEAKEAAERAAAELSEKETLLSKANIPASFASFLAGDKDSWQEQVDALATLREQADATPAPSVPRDPAVDADLEAEDDGLSEALGFFGFADQ